MTFKGTAHMVNADSTNHPVSVESPAFTTHNIGVGEVGVGGAASQNVGLQVCK